MAILHAHTLPTACTPRQHIFHPMRDTRYAQSCPFAKPPSHPIPRVQPSRLRVTFGARRPKPPIGSPNPPHRAYASPRRLAPPHAFRRSSPSAVRSTLHIEPTHVLCVSLRPMRSAVRAHQRLVRATFMHRLTLSKGTSAQCTSSLHACQGHPREASCQR
jgi:hypothetical protein